MESPQKRSHNEVDPDYADNQEEQIKRQKLLELDGKNAVRKKIHTIITTQFSKEIENREKELQNVDKRLNDARLMLDRLRACVVANYYSTPSNSSGSQLSTMAAPPPSIHPAVKRVVGKRPAGEVNRTETQHAPKQSNETFAFSVKLESIPSVSTSNTARAKAEPSISNEFLDQNLSLQSAASFDDRRARFKVKKKIIVGNVSKYIPVDEREANDMSSHKWMIYVRGPRSNPEIGGFVKKVWFFLHHSYKPNDLVEVSSPPFHLTRRGWGEFPVRVQLHFVDPRNKKVDIIHHLKLDKTFSGLQTLGAETIVEAELERDVLVGEPTSQGSSRTASPIPQPADYINTLTSKSISTISSIKEETTPLSDTDVCIKTETDEASTENLSNTDIKSETNSILDIERFSDSNVYDDVSNIDCNKETVSSSGMCDDFGYNLTVEHDVELKDEEEIEVDVCSESTTRKFTLLNKKQSGRSVLMPDTNLSSLETHQTEHTKDVKVDRESINDVKNYKLNTNTPVLLSQGSSVIKEKSVSNSGISNLPFKVISMPVSKASDQCSLNLSSKFQLQNSVFQQLPKSVVHNPSVQTVPTVFALNSTSLSTLSNNSVVSVISNPSKAKIIRINKQLSSGSMNNISTAKVIQLNQLPKTRVAATVNVSTTKPLTSVSLEQPVNTNPISLPKILNSVNRPISLSSPKSLLQETSGKVVPQSLHRSNKQTILKSNSDSSLVVVNSEPVRQSMSAHSILNSCDNVKLGVQKSPKTSQPKQVSLLTGLVVNSPEMNPGKVMTLETVSPLIKGRTLPQTLQEKPQILSQKTEPAIVNTAGRLSSSSSRALTLQPTPSTKTTLVKSQAPQIIRKDGQLYLLSKPQTSSAHNSSNLSNPQPIKTVVLNGNVKSTNQNFSILPNGNVSINPVNITQSANPTQKMSAIGITKHGKTTRAVQSIDGEKPKTCYDILHAWKNNPELYERPNIKKKIAEDRIDGTLEVIPLLKTNDFMSMSSLTKAALKRHPLIQNDVNKLTHPYCAVSQEEFESWPVGKQRASEWSRASCTLKYLSKCLGGAGEFVGESLMSTADLVRWARIQAMSPVQPITKSPRVKKAVIERQYPMFSSKLLSYTCQSDIGNELDTISASTDTNNTDLDIESVDCKQAPTAEDEPLTTESTESLPLSDSATFVVDFLRKRGLKLTSTEIVPGVVGFTAADMLMKATLQFASELLQESHAIINSKRFQSDTLTEKHIFRALTHMPEASFCSSRYLGKDLEPADILNPSR